MSITNCPHCQKPLGHRKSRISVHSCVHCHRPVEPLMTSLGTPLTRDHWTFQGGTQGDMATGKYNGKSFDAIFEQAMGWLFFDKNGVPGAIYSSPSVYQSSQAVVAQNKGTWGYTDFTLQMYFKQGLFDYDYPDPSFPEWYKVPLSIDGPDPGDFGAGILSKVPEIVGQLVKVDYELIISVTRDFAGGDNASGSNFIIVLTAATMLHEIMHNHGWTHPDAVNWTPGSDYAKMLPHVAFWSVMKTGGYDFWVQEQYSLSLVDFIAKFGKDPM
jgi:hypothetical protein